jgi:hypothetical protein
VSWDVPARFHTASYNAVCWVEVWRGPTLLATVPSSEFVGGSVSDTWVTAGVRRTLSLTVPRTDDWLGWLQIGVDLRPFRGMKLTSGDIVCPLGRFPVRKFTRPRSPSTISISAQDRWQWVVAAKMFGNVKAYGGLVSEVASLLIGEVDPFGLGMTRTNTATSSATVAPGVWQPDRSGTIADLVESIGAEAFMDRTGAPVIRDRPTVGDPVVEIRSGNGGTLIDETGEIDWESVINSVVVVDSTTDSVLEPVHLAINDTNDPAHRSNISGGAESGGWQSMVYSAQFTDAEQMRQAGIAQLAKFAAPARQWSVQMPPDVSLDAGDTVLLETLDGDILGQIQSITHPLDDAAASLTVSYGRNAEAGVGPLIPPEYLIIGSGLIGVGVLG